MTLRIITIDLEQLKFTYGEDVHISYIGGLVLEDGEATMRFKPSKDQCDQLWSTLEPLVITWAKSLITGEPS